MYLISFSSQFYNFPSLRCCKQRPQKQCSNDYNNVSRQLFYFHRHKAPNITKIKKDLRKQYHTPLMYGKSILLCIFNNINRMCNSEQIQVRHNLFWTFVKLDPNYYDTFTFKSDLFQNINLIIYYNLCCRLSTLNHHALNLL